MTKVLVIPNSLEMIDKLSNKCDGFIIGLQELSINMPITFSLKQIEKITKELNKKQKEVFISINKNIHNSELEKLEEILLFLNKLSISGFLYYDIAIVNLKEKLKLNYPLVWSQEHLTTNYTTCNFWQKNGVDNAYISSDITIQEIIDIKENTSVKLFVTVFGYLPMFTSFRHLVKNYLKTFSIDNVDNKLYKISKEGNEYPIVDNELGTFVYSNNILNGIDEYLLLKEKQIDYAVLNAFHIDDNDFTKIVELFTNANKNNVRDFSSQIEQICPNWDKGFFYKETVYKVKNNEKDNK